MKMYFHNIDHCLKMMSIVGVQPSTERGFYQYLRYILLVLSICIIWCLVLMYPYYREEKMTLLNMTPVVTSVCLFAHSISKLSNLFFKGRQIQNLLGYIQNSFWKIEDINESEDRAYFILRTNWIKRMYHIYSFMSTNTATYFYCGRIFLDGLPVDRNLPFESHIPFDIPFTVLFVYELIIGYVLVIPIVAMDIFISTTILLTALQCKHLSMEFRNIFCDDNDDNIKRRFKRCNDHHTFLINFRVELNQIFANGMLAYMLVIVPTLCIEMYILSTEKSLKEGIRAFSYSATLFFEFFMCYCLPAQYLNDEAELLANSVYVGNWHLHSKHSKDLVLLLGKSHLKMEMSAGGYTNIDLKAGFAALKSMVSYCMFLRTVGVSQD